MTPLKVGGLYLHNCGCVSVGTSRCEGPGAWFSIVLRLKHPCGTSSSHMSTTAYYREDTGTYNGAEYHTNYALHVKREIEP